MRSFYFALPALLFLLAGNRSFAQCGSNNLALNAPATSPNPFITSPTRATDGDTLTSAWITSGVTNPVLIVDLGASYALCSMRILWLSTGTRAVAYTVELSPDQSTWTNIQTVTGNATAKNAFSVTGTGRYIRVTLTQAVSPALFYSMLELQAFQNLGCNSANIAQGHGATASSSSPGFPASNAFDGSTLTSWHSAGSITFSNPANLTVDLGAAQNLCSVGISFTNGTEIANSYTIDVSNTSATSGFTTAATVSNNMSQTNAVGLSTNARWVRFQGVTAASITGYSIAEMTVSAPLVILPVHLANFTATNINNQQVQLKWTTETETNNKVFLIQRSGDGSTYTNIGQVDGAINSNTALDYSWMDNSPLKGTDFYRLEQVDLDGKSGFSDIQVVRIGGEASLSVFPNPVRDLLTIVNPKGSLIREVAVYNTSGVVLSKLAPMSTGSIQVQAGGWAAGVYLVKVTTDEGSQIIKVMK